jgi:hypothetical protein
MSLPPSSSSHSAIVFSRKAVSKKRRISSRRASENWSGMKSSRPKWRQSVDQKCCSYAPTVTYRRSRVS